jgi:hypothetical protein
MAIQRCPYCKAIIDEGAEYCTNCGTKLLFPEDEFIEEEIPGEKIIDVDEDLTGTQKELKEGKEEEKKEEESPPADVDEEAVLSPLDGEPIVEEDTGEEKPEDAEDAEAKDEPGDDDAALKGEEAEAEEKSEEKKKPAPKKKAASRKRKSTKKKAAPKKTKKEEPVKVVADEEGKPEEPAVPDKPEEPEQAEAAPEEPAPGEEVRAAETEPDSEEEAPAGEAEARPEEDPEERDKTPGPEDVFPFEPEYVEDEVIPASQDAASEKDFEGIDTRRGVTDDLPQGFAEAIDEAREKVGEPLEELTQGEGEEAPKDEEPVEEKLTPEPGTAEEKEWQTPPPEGEALKEPPTQEEETVQTGDIEDIVDEAEKEKEEIDDFIASIKKERNAVRDQIKSDTQDIPPWAADMQDGPLPDIPPTDEIGIREEDAEEEGKIEDGALIEGEEEKIPEEEPPVSPKPEAAETPGPGYDTRSAFPETVDQQGLPFVATSEAHEDEPLEEEPFEEEPESKKLHVRRKTQPVGFGEWIKSRIFDVVFVSALWFVALWISSQVLGISVFSILAVSTGVALGFLALLLLLYFFFFLYFLGETLGNYLFSSEE